MKRVLLLVMGVFYVVAGYNHFANADVYLPMMPPYIPFHRAMIAISGAAEMAGGVGILIPATRRAAAWGLVLLLVAIFPANLHIALHDVPLFGRSEGFGVWNWVRLPFQGVLIVWAWWYTRDDRRAGAADVRG